MYSLAAIAVCRLIRITRSHLYRKLFTSCKIAITVTLSWIVPAGSLTILVVNGNAYLGYDERLKICAANGEIGAWFIFAVFEIWVPGVVIVLSYIRIYVYVKRHFKAQKNSIVSISSNSRDNDLKKESQQGSEKTANEDSATTTSITIPDNRRRDQLSKQQIEITKNLFVVVCAFAACTMPYFVVFSFPRIGIVDHILFYHVYVKIAPLANSSINFVIYANRHPYFKIVLRHMMKRSYSDIPKPSKFLKFLLSKKK